MSRIDASGRSLILGHRGSPREATENTLRSFDLALRSGADGVELDVQRSLDDVPVVIHDRTLTRTMGMDGEIARLHWQAVERITGARVPSLDQALAWAAASGAWVNVEIKAALAEEAVLERVFEKGVGDRVILSSFEPAILHRLGELAPTLRRFLLTERWHAGARRLLQSTGAGGVCLRVDAATEASLDELEERGMPVIVWTVNDPEVLLALLSRGVAGIITDDPGTAVKIRSSLETEGRVA